jgi:hypothetical protein
VGEEELADARERLDPRIADHHEDPPDGVPRLLRQDREPGDHERDHHEDEGELASPVLGHGRRRRGDELEPDDEDQVRGVADRGQPDPPVRPDVAVADAASGAPVLGHDRARHGRIMPARPGGPHRG